MKMMLKALLAAGLASTLLAQTDDILRAQKKAAALEAAADQAKLRWVVVRHEIDYKQAAYLGDAIIAKTWVGTASSLRFERHTELLRANDRTVLARARTVWCPLDAQTGKPVSVSDQVRAAFSVEPQSGSVL